MARMQQIRATQPLFADEPEGPVLGPWPAARGAPPAIPPKMPPPRPLAAADIDPAALDRMGVLRCLRDGVAPLVRAGHRRPVAMTDPGAAIPGLAGPLRRRPVDDLDLQRATLAHRRQDLARRAATHCPARASCRSLRPPGIAATLAVAMLAAALALAWPGPLAQGLAMTAVLAVLVTMGFKIVLAIAAGWPVPPSPAPVPMALAELPQITLLVPLLHEAAVATGLVAALGRLVYPRDRLEILLLVEEGDNCTLNALAGVALPPEMRVILVPDGAPRTKPRALNHGLSLARGGIIGIFDAEDRPDPRQLMAVAQGFNRAPPALACLQGRLTFYNARDGIIQRAFALDYGAWFGVLMRGLDKLRLPIPLGGTTVFLRRDVLDRLGGWDAHNVTEDADLGLRLARAGFRTGLIDSATGEEALARPWPWIRQRSRWIKGFVMTWRVLMRRPGAALRDLGIPGFITAQILLLGPLAGLLTLPVTLSFWGALAGWPGPFWGALPPGWAGLAGLVFPLLALAQATILVAGRPRDIRARDILWMLPLMPLYHMMGAFAALKAIWEIGAQPFFWDKTAHGHAQAPRAPSPPS